MDYKSFIAAMQADTEEEDKRRQQRLRERAQAARQQRNQPQQDDRNVIERIGDALGAVGNVGKSIFVDPIVDSVKTAGEGVGHIVDDISGASADRERQFNESQNQSQRMLMDALKRKADESLSPEERDRAAKSAESISNSMDAEFENFQAGLNSKLDETDPLKQAGATVTLATSVLPAKIGSVGKLGTVAKNGSKLARAGENVVSDAAIAASASAADLARREGSDASVQDLAAAGGTGALFGGALSTGGQLLNRGVRQEAGAAIGNVRDDIQESMAAYNSLPRTAREGGYVKVPGTAPDVASRLDETLGSVSAPGTRPGEMNPATKLLDNTSPVDEGIVTKPREQIMLDNKVQRKAGDKFYEALFDSNAPLREYGKAYEKKTGQKLDVENDPAALAQLVNGMDEAGAARMRPLMEDMEYIRQNKLSDAWKEFGIANQVVNDRADVYAPGIVAAEKRKLEELQKRLTPEQFQQVQTAVQRTIEFQDGQLQRMRDAGFISEEGYNAIKEVNPNYFTRFNFAEYIDDNQRLFASTNSKNISTNLIKAVKGKGDDGKYVIEDPAEAISRAAIKTENLIQRNKIFHSIGALADELPDLAVKLRDADDVAARMDLSLENQELRPIRDYLDRAIKRDNATARRLQSAIDQLEKKGMNLSIKNGGERMTNDPLSIPGLGGNVSTSQAGQLVKTAQDDSTDLVKQLDSALRKNSKSVDGIRQDVIAEGAGTVAETNASKLGASDTRSVINNLIERGSQADIDKIKKMVGRRDQKLNDLLDDIGFAKNQYEEKATRIRDNINEGKSLADLDVPEGYEAILGYRNGIQERIAVPQYIADAYKGKNDAQIGAMERIMSAGSKPFKAAATIFSPAFLVKNSIRDTGTHWLTSQNISKADRLLIVPYAKRWVQGFMDSMTNSDFAQSITEAGGGAAGVFNTASDVAKGTQKVVEATAKGITGKAVDSPKNMFIKAAEMIGVAQLGRGYSQVMQRTGRALEYAPRLAEARAAIEKGASDPAAALAARNALGDLQNGGTVARLLNNYTPFFNSILQGNKRIVDAARENPQNAIAMASAGIVLPAVSGYLWNRTMYPDVLNNIPAYERENNFIIILGDEQDADGKYTQVLKIPKNDAAKVFGNNIEVAMDKMAGQDSQGFAELFMKTIGYAQPVQLERDGELSLGAMIGSAPITSNPLVKTPFELATNQSLFTGREITPGYLEGLNPEDQVQDNTSAIDAGAAQILDPIAGIAGADVSPQQVAQARQGVSAGLLNGKSPVDQVKNVVSGSNGTRASNEFYKTRDEVQVVRKKASNAINKAIAAGDIEAAQGIAARYNEIFAEKFQPWIKTYGAQGTDEMRESFQALKLNLSSRAIKQRRKNISEDQ